MVLRHSLLSPIAKIYKKIPDKTLNPIGFEHLHLINSDTEICAAVMKEFIKLKLPDSYAMKIIYLVISLYCKHESRCFFTWIWSFRCRFTTKWTALQNRHCHFFDTSTHSLACSARSLWCAPCCSFPLSTIAPVKPKKSNTNLHHSILWLFLLDICSCFKVVGHAEEISRCC